MMQTRKYSQRMSLFVYLLYFPFSLSFFIINLPLQSCTHFIYGFFFRAALHTHYPTNQYINKRSLMVSCKPISSPLIFFFHSPLRSICFVMHSPLRSICFLIHSSLRRILLLGTELLSLIPHINRGIVVLSQLMINRERCKKFSKDVNVVVVWLYRGGKFAHY